MSFELAARYYLSMIAPPHHPDKEVWCQKQPRLEREVDTVDTADASGSPILWPAHDLSSPK